MMKKIVTPTPQVPFATKHIDALPYKTKGYKVKVNKGLYLYVGPTQTKHWIKLIKPKTYIELGYYCHGALPADQLVNVAKAKLMDRTVERLRIAGKDPLQDPAFLNMLPDSMNPNYFNKDDFNLHLNKENGENKKEEKDTSVAWPDQSTDELKFLEEMKEKLSKGISKKELMDEAGSEVINKLFDILKRTALASAPLQPAKTTSFPEPKDSQASLIHRQAQYYRVETLTDVLGNVGKIYEIYANSEEHAHYFNIPLIEEFMEVANIVWENVKLHHLSFKIYQEGHKND